jgi:hypothetical protein
MNTINLRKNRKKISYNLGERTGHNNNVYKKDCVYNLNYNTLNNLKTNYSIESDLNRLNRRPVVKLMYVDDPSKVYKANYSQGARGYNYYKTKVNHYKAPINVGQPNNDWKTEPCVNNRRYRSLNNLNKNHTLGSDYTKNNSKLVNLIAPPGDYSVQISYSGQQRGNTGSLKNSTCVLNKRYTRYNNEKNNYLHSITRNKVMESNRVHLMKPPTVKDTYTANYYSMNRMQ